MGMLKAGMGLVVFTMVVAVAGQSSRAAENPITVKVESLENVRGNGALEACGTAVHKDGIKPLMVTLKHDESYYTVLSGPNSKWCVVFMRWTFDGKIDVSATTLQNPEKMEFRTIDLSAIQKR